MILEALEAPPVDPDDQVGRRCHDPNPELGVSCYRRADHDRRGEPWHYGLTGKSTPESPGQHWRWKDT